MVGQDNGVEARGILHEEQRSANVASVHNRMTRHLWVLHYAQDYLLGVLQLLEREHLLRDLEEEKAEKERHAQLVKAFDPTRTPRERAYGRLLRMVMDALPDSFCDAVNAAADVTTEERYQAAKPTPLIAASWRHRGDTKDALALARVRKLVRDSYKRKTISRADLLEALGESD